ncbi:MAG: hypothetical protein FWB74_00170 [Defluviitaleaceae bacterium]|nr:hypothetical protein [Defluviitaleaceae bacterium]
MDIANMSMLSRYASEGPVMREINLSLMRNALDATELQGEMIAELLGAIPPVGFDGLGANLDVYM